MTSREQFEAAISASPFERSVARWPSDPTKYSWPGTYKDLAVDLGWCMWQDSRKQALQEAKALCVEQIDPSAQYPDFQGGWSTGAQLCAEAIERLINPKGEPS